MINNILFFCCIFIIVFILLNTIRLFGTLIIVIIAVYILYIYDKNEQFEDVGLNAERQYDGHDDNIDSNADNESIDNQLLNEDGINPTDLMFKDVTQVFNIKNSERTWNNETVHYGPPDTISFAKFLCL